MLQSLYYRPKHIGNTHKTHKKWEKPTLLIELCYAACFRDGIHKNTMNNHFMEAQLNVLHCIGK